jgi:putative Mg2+ transporter-C (MgtC) family protein
MPLADIGIRLFVAAVIGCLIGLNRFAHHRYIGVRTLALVSLGSAALVLAPLEIGSSSSDQLVAASRIIQGIVTGIGFIGAGVIIKREHGHKVHGLTTAATVWVSAAAGILCGLGAWRVAAIVTVLVGVVLSRAVQWKSSWCATMVRMLRTSIRLRRMGRPQSPKREIENLDSRYA